MDYDYKILMEKWGRYVESWPEWDSLRKNLKVIPYKEDHKPVREWWGDL